MSKPDMDYLLRQVSDAYSAMAEAERDLAKAVGSTEYDVAYFCHREIERMASCTARFVDAMRAAIKAGEGAEE